ncbi:hypothetical protein [Pseudophaeobacter sp.]|jgi:glycosyltransferase involved in cell wall biosynthesis|uniref:hypothetical protein n=1 Tax=Pseudophaeobacter sp. TaxID=1971739 RepID=UPI0025FAF7C6|nr:hypothetical protein [uncultured Pseudophaeobacter sp.]
MSSKILIAVRFDAEAKNGGDYQMMRAFAAELQRPFETEICFGVPKADQLNDVAAVLATNLDRPLEAWRTMLACQARGIPFVIYTLHHPHAGIEAYLRTGTQGIKAKIAKAADFDPVSYEAILWRIRTVASVMKLRGWLPQGSVREAQKSLVQHADAVVCCASAEIDVLSGDIARPEHCYIVPHPTDAPPAAGAETVPGRVVVAGRIEARKNQITALEIARALSNLDFVFVGGKVNSEAEYFANFETSLANTPNASYKPNLPKADFYPFLASAEIVLNPSFFEVTSLIDVWCVENSLPLVTTTHTYLRGEGAFGQFDPTSTEDGIRVLKHTLETARTGRRSLKPLRDANTTTMVNVMGSLT